jgi:hypothetical protein
MVLIQFFGFGQNIEDILILVKSSDNTFISSAHLTLDNKEHYISNQNGEIRLLSSNKNLAIQISHIGYATLDTVLNTTDIQSFTLILRESSYTIDPVTISDQQRLFEKNKWAITDITYHDYGFVVSASEKSKKYIYLFDKDGIQILKESTKFKHQTIEQGLKSGHFHLMNNKEGQEIMVSTDTIIFLSKSPIEKYEKTLLHYKYTNNNYTIAEEWSQHNKKFILSVIDNKSYKRTPFYQSFDQESFIRSQSVYREIIRLYYRDCHKLNPLWKPGDISDNIIADGTWSGDLYDLIVSDTIQEVYNYYKSIYVKEISVSTAVKRNSLFVLDDMKRTMFVYSLDKQEISQEPIIIKLPDEIKKGQFVDCGHDSELIIMSDDSYFSFHLDEHRFKPIHFQKRNYYYPKSTFVDNEILYVLAQRSKIKHRKSIFKCIKVDHTE